MTYYCLVKKRLFNFLLISFVASAAYYVASIWGHGAPIVQSKDFFWIVAGVAFTYLFVLPLIMLLLEKDAD
jgi:hypothetical protein